jgi:cytochrome b6-f complex iron-sulfur subunit
MNPSGEPIGRRAFLWTAALSGLAALLGEWVPQRWTSAAATITPFPIPGAADLSAGSALTFTVPGTTIPGVLVRLAADAYAAFDQRCPHLGCPVQWSPQRECFECPCHKAVFDRSMGRVLSGPPQRGLHPIAIERRGGDVWALDVSADEQDGKNERSV